MGRGRSGRFVNPELIGGIDPALMRRLLEQFRDSLETQGYGALFHPDGPDDSELVRLLSDLSRLPDDLVDRIGVVDEMARGVHFDALMRELNDAGIDPGDDPSVGDLVVRLLLDAPEGLERAYAERLPLARRKFRSHLALAETPPRIERIDDRAVDHLRRALEEDFIRRQRGGGVRVYPVKTDDGFRLLVRRGDAIQRQAVIDMVTTETRRIAFRPERFDALVYRSDEGELRVNARTDADARAYLEHIGRCVFGRDSLFVADGLPARYVLNPIVDRGEKCLVCDDVPEISRVRLTSLEWVNEASALKVKVGPHPDVFRALRSQPTPDEWFSRELVSATFRVTYRSGRELSHRVVPPNDAVGDDCEVFLRWLSLRGFFQDREAATRGLRSLAAS